MFKPNGRTNSSNVREFEELIELKNFKVSDKPANDLKKPLLGDKKTVILIIKY